MHRRKVFGALGALAMVAATAAYAAGQFPGYPTPGSSPGYPYITGNENVPADTLLPGGAFPQTVTIPSSAIGATWGTPRNFLGNGALNITNTNGTGTVTCAQNAAIATTGLSADRWGCIANVAVGAGRTAIVTSSPSPPAGFTNVMKVFRTSGALTQPVCVMSAVPTPDATQLAGQVVTFSAYIAALAGLSADNGNVVNMIVISGTGTDEGLNATPTASPAITPAWTGITTVVNTSLSVSTTFARYSTTVTIPATATEVGVEICFTPTAAGSGATDGFAWTGAQLERSGVASLFEVQPKEKDAAAALKYFYKLSEGAGAGAVIAGGFTSTTSLAEGILPFPVQMYKTPTMTYTAGFGSCTTTACTGNTACTALRTSTLQTFLATQVNVPIECTSTAGFPAAGSSIYILSMGGSGVINAWTGL
jgi:hypothetical protein